VADEVLQGRPARIGSATMTYFGDAAMTAFGDMQSPDFA
jgi:hypothetical protein